MVVANCVHMNIYQIILHTPPDERQSSVFYKVQIQTGKSQFLYHSTTQSDHDMHNCKVKIY